MASGKPRRIRRRWLLAAIVAIVATVVGWQLIELTLGVDRFRPQVEAELARATGLAARVGRLDLAWRPMPCLSAVEVSLGDGALRIEAARVDLFPALHALPWRRVEIPRIAIDELVVTLPPDRAELERASEEVRSHLERAFAGDGSEGTSSAWSVSVARVRAESAALRFGDAEPAATIDLVVAGLDAETLAFSVDAFVPASDARIRGEASLPRGADPALAGLNGGFDLVADRPGPLLGLPSFLDSRWEGRGELSGTDTGALRVNLQGHFAPQDEVAMRGRFEGQARVGGGAPATAELAVSGEGFSLDASLDASRDAYLHVDALSLHGASLARALRSASSDAFQLAPEDGARLEAAGLAVDVGPEGWPHVLAGELSAAGIRVSRGALSIAEGARVDARWNDGALTLSDLRAGPLALRGRLTPGPAWRHVDLALSGELRLVDAWLHAAGAPESLRDVRGRLRLDEIAGRLPVADDSGPLEVRARLERGSLRVASESGGDLDEISGVSLQLSSREGRVFAEGSAHSRQLGDLALRTTLDPAARRAHGNLSLDATHLAAYVSDPALRARVAPLLESVGAGRIGFRLAPVEGSDGTWDLALTRDDPPRLSATLAFAPGAEEPLGDLEAKIEIPGAGLRGLLPEGARASGVAALRLARDAGAGAFELDADLASLDFASGRFVGKAAGEPLALHVAGGGDGGPWTPRRVALRGASDTLALAWREGGPVASDLDLDLADWSYLLTGGASASGRLRGSFDGPASQLDLALEAVALRLGEDVGLDAIDGAVDRDGQNWSVRALRLRGPGSDATLDAALSEGTLRGELTGSLDLDFVRALVDEVRALRTEAVPDEDDAPPITGELAIRLDRVGYGRSEGRHVNATIAFAEGDVAVRDLAFDTYEGKVSGSVEILRGDPGRLRLALDIAGVTGRFLDDALFDPPRDIRGRFDAALQLDAPLLGDAVATLAEADGGLRLKGREGSFGKGGLASKLLTVLRSTEALRGKLPAFRDEGLVFDTTRLEVALARGVGSVEVLDVDSKAYAIDGSGTLDFRDEQSDVPLEVNLIKGLSGAVSWIPVAGDALRILNVRVNVTGSPWDLQVGVAGVRDQLLGAGRAGMGAVVGNASDALRLLRRGEGSEAGEEGVSTPDPERDLPGAAASEEPTPTSSEQSPAPTAPGAGGGSDEPEPAPGEPL